MESLLESQFTWTNLLVAAVLLVGFYFLLQFVKELLSRASFFGDFQKDIKAIINYLLLICEPIAVLIVVGIFILINPVFHGLLALLVLLGGYNHVKNYLNGRIVLYDPAISIGRRIKTKDIQGIISSTGRIGTPIANRQGTSVCQLYSIICRWVHVVIRRRSRWLF